MNIKINLSEAYFLKRVMETFLKFEKKDKQTLALAKDILNKLKK